MRHLKCLWFGAVLVLAPVCVASGDEDLSKKHDYATVGISKLSPLELTFVPEWRKEPILKALLAGARWELRKDVRQAPQCTALLKDLLAWKDIEIVEPTIRANRYGDPAFEPWRRQCPNFDPHVDESDAGTTYGSHHFKAFEVLELKKGQVVFYFEGNPPDKFMDRFGNLLIKNYTYSGGGQYRIIDLNACKVTAWLARPTSPVSFSHYVSKARGYRTEGVVVKLNQRHKIVTLSLGSSSPLFYGRVVIYPITSSTTEGTEPECEFFGRKPSDRE